MLSPYRTAGAHNQMIEGSGHPQETYEIALQPFVSLLEFVSEIYQVSVLFPLLYATWEFLRVLFMVYDVDGILIFMYELFVISH